MSEERYRTCVRENGYMPVDWSAFVAGLAAFGAAIGYFAKKYVDLRLGAVSQFHTQKFDAIVHIRGLLTEVDHCVLHIARGEERYVDVLKQHYATVRKESRAKSALLGDNLVTSIRNATDTALTYCTLPEESMRGQWDDQLRSLYEQCDTKLRTVEISPKFNRDRQLPSNE